MTSAELHFSDKVTFTNFRGQDVVTPEDTTLHTGVRTWSPLRTRLCPHTGVRTESPLRNDSPHAGHDVITPEDLTLSTHRGQDGVTPEVITLSPRGGQDMVTPEE